MCNAEVCNAATKVIFQRRGRHTYIAGQPPYLLGKCKTWTVDSGLN